MNANVIYTEKEKQFLNKMCARIKGREKDFKEYPSLDNYGRLLSGMVFIEVYKENIKRKYSSEVIKKPIFLDPIRKVSEQKLRKKFHIPDSIPVIYK